jgi:hypothetical protein
MADNSESCCFTFSSKWKCFCKLNLCQKPSSGFNIASPEYTYRAQTLHQNIHLIILSPNIIKNVKCKSVFYDYAKLCLPLIVLSALSLILVYISSLQGKSISNTTSSSILCYLERLEILIAA